MNVNLVIGLKFKAEGQCDELFRLNDVVTIRNFKNEMVFYSINRKRKLFQMMDEDLKTLIEEGVLKSI